VRKRVKYSGIVSHRRIKGPGFHRLLEGVSICYSPGTTSSRR